MSTELDELGEKILLGRYFVDMLTHVVTSTEKPGSRLTVIWF